MRIAIFGQYRTGTTALFHCVRRACPPWIRCLHEPTAYRRSAADRLRGVLAKVILGAGRATDFIGFERRVLVVRDPRDWLVSGMMFLPQQRPEIHENPQALDEIQQLLSQKEASPGSVSVVRLLDTMLGYLSTKERDDVRQTIRRLLGATIRFERALGNGLKIRYEEFVDRRIAPLEDYLDLQLDPRVEVPSQREHVPRTLGYDNWRSWFTEEDVRFFRPLMSRFLSSQDYPDDWSLERLERLDPSHGSGYVARTVAWRLGRGASAK